MDPSLRDRAAAATARPREPGEKPLWRRIGKWALIAAVAWFLLSVVLFAVSAQIQKGKLDDRAGDLLGGSPFLAATGGTILVIGTDARPEATGAEEAETRSKCIDQGATGSAPSSDCPGFRADTLMLVRAGGGAFEKVSIPRDTLADIPGQGPAKINGAYSAGGAALQIETVENFLGIEVDHVIILDFEGFADFIDSIGGVTVNLPDRVKSEVDGGGAAGGVTLKLDPGENDLNGQEALALARTRVNQAEPGRGRHRPRPPPAADPAGDQGPADQPVADPDQLPARAADRLERAEGDGHRHGRAAAAAARARLGDRRRLRHQDPEPVGDERRRRPDRLGEPVPPCGRGAPRGARAAAARVLAGRLSWSWQRVAARSCRSFELDCCLAVGLRAPVRTRRFFFSDFPSDFELPSLFEPPFESPPSPPGFFPLRA